jgi:head-tail adaptor
MRVPAFKRDTLITFQERTGTQDSGTGAWSYAWRDLLTDPDEWAEVQDILPSRAEDVADNIDIRRRPCRIRTLFRDDITSAMRVAFEGRTLEIIAGPVELGRRDGLEMICEELSTQGEKP